MLDWDGKARALLKAEMAKRRMRAPALAEALAKLGIHEQPANLKNKINRGAFSADFLLQCLAAMDVTTLHLD